MYKSYQNSRGYFVLHEDVGRKLKIINHYVTKPGPMVLVFPIWDWHSIYTYYTGKKAVIIMITQLNDIDNYRKQGYAYVIFQDFNPGQIDENVLKKYDLTFIHDDKGILIAQFNR